MTAGIAPVHEVSKPANETTHNADVRGNPERHAQGSRQGQEHDARPVFVFRGKHNLFELPSRSARAAADPQQENANKSAVPLRAQAERPVNGREASGGGGPRRGGKEGLSNPRQAAPPGYWRAAPAGRAMARPADHTTDPCSALRPLVWRCIAYGAKTTTGARNGRTHTHTCARDGRRARRAT